ncbi:MAG: hypothetical protein JJT96_19570 [Opitutales bacterium]|nr:hypothetical protein [Opitutales bacterium]
MNPLTGVFDFDFDTTSFRQAFSMARSAIHCRKLPYFLADPGIGPIQDNECPHRLGLSDKSRPFPARPMKNPPKVSKDPEFCTSTKNHA